MIINKDIRQTINKYVYLLRQGPDDLANIACFVEETLNLFKRDLLRLGAIDFALDLFLSYRYLCFEAEHQMLIPDAIDEISSILIGHLRVEHFMREYLRSRFLFSSSNCEHVQSYSYFECLEEVEKNLGQKMEFSDMLSGLREIDRVRNAVSLDLNYKIRSDDLTAVIQYMRNWQELCMESSSPLITVYWDFSDICCNFFRGSAWGQISLKRRIDNLPEPEDDWLDFIRKYGI